MSDEAFMRRALELAALGRGRVEPNPMVGSVVVRDGVIVGEGFHERFGAAHAETNALAQAGSASRGATLFVSLEPCCHHGKTPPCTDQIISAGVARVVVARPDPFEKVQGAGIRLLRQAGVVVDVGTLQEESSRLNAPYLKLLSTGLPFVHAKWAMSLDGKIATVAGVSKWMSSEASRRIVHQLRGTVDGILVGMGTVLTDDPLLTARPPGPRTPLRIVLDSRGRLPPSSHLARTARDIPVLVATTAGADASALDRLRALGCECLVLPNTDRGVAIEPLLAELGKRSCTNILVEGGSRALGSFLDARQIDEVHVFVVPKVLGGDKAPVAVAGLGVSRLDDSLRLESYELHRIDTDVLIHGRTQRDEESIAQMTAPCQLAGRSE